MKPVDLPTVANPEKLNFQGRRTFFEVALNRKVSDRGRSLAHVSASVNCTFRVFEMFKRTELSKHHKQTIDFVLALGYGHQLRRCPGNQFLRIPMINNFRHGILKVSRGLVIKLNGAGYENGRGNNN